MENTSNLEYAQKMFDRAQADVSHWTSELWKAEEKLFLKQITPEECDRIRKLQRHARMNLTRRREELEAAERRNVKKEPKP